MRVTCNPPNSPSCLAGLSGQKKHGDAGHGNYLPKELLTALQALPLLLLWTYASALELDNDTRLPGGMQYSVVHHRHSYAYTKQSQHNLCRISKCAIAAGFAFEHL